MNFYRNKPIVVEAMVIGKPWNALRKFAPEITFVRRPNGRGVAFVVISTPEGEMRGEIGDYLIRGVKGEVYPCKPDVFEATYEKTTEARAFCAA